MGNLLTLLIFLLGLITVGLSVLAAVKFYTYQKSLGSQARRLSNAISWQLVGEGVIGLGTLVFATAAHFDVLKDWSIEVQSFLRLSMFIATASTTVHLLNVLVKLEKS